MNKTSLFQDLTRISNNPVENRFGHIKHNLLKKQNKVLTSEFVTPILGAAVIMVLMDRH